MTPPLLPRITGPADLKSLTFPELKQLAQEIRDELIRNIATTGGHFAPNLGVVELTLALHTVYDSPTDKLVWDVGHQSYPHKMVTGRQAGFATLKQLGGMSGYCKRKESVHDHFEAGHGSTSISAALGYAKARDLRHGKESVVAIIGDGSLTGGMALEGLNNAGHLKTDIVIVLNDNEMSIAPNVGALAAYLARVRTDSRYLRLKQDVEFIMQRLPMGAAILESLGRLKDSAKSLLVPGMLFEELGLTYMGPIDGHDIEALQQTLTRAKRLGGPVLVHAVTVKGKGYPHAESNAFRWHATTPFDIETGETKKSATLTYTNVFSKTLVEMADRDPRIVAITAAMPDGTGLIEFGKRFPERFFDVGMAEQHAVTFAAGLASSGMRPVAAIYSTFLQRAYDQIIHDVCLQGGDGLPVTFCLDRGGIVGEDGDTHAGIFDLSYLRSIPNMVVMAPKDEEEMRRMMHTALAHDGPAAIRYPRGAGPGTPLGDETRPLPLGQGEILRVGDDLALVGIGAMVVPMLEAAEVLASEGIEATVINARFVKPLDVELIARVARRTGRLLTAEDNVLMGGFGSAVLEALEQAGLLADVQVRRLGLPDRFPEHGARAQIMSRMGLDTGGILAAARELVGAGTRVVGSSGR